MPQFSEKRTSLSAFEVPGQASRQALEECKNPPPRQLRANNNLAGSIHCVDLKYGLRNIQRDCRDVAHGGAPPAHSRDHTARKEESRPPHQRSVCLRLIGGEHEWRQQFLPTVNPVSLSLGYGKAPVARRTQAVLDAQLNGFGCCDTQKLLLFFSAQLSRAARRVRYKRRAITQPPQTRLS